MKYNFIEMKPCPFCGSDSLSVVSKRSTTYATSKKGFCKVTFSVRCNVCKARGCTASTEMPNLHYKFIKGASCEDLASAYFEACDRWNERK